MNTFTQNNYFVYFKYTLGVNRLFFHIYNEGKDSMHFEKHCGYNLKTLFFFKDYLISIFVFLFLPFYIIGPSILNFDNFSLFIKYLV